VKVIGLTGGIGSGKSLVAKVLEAMGYPIYYSDERSRELVDKDQDIKKELTELLGDEVYSDGQLNRSFLAEKLFSNDEVRLKVNSIIHPRVRAGFALWVSEQRSHVVFNEAAILFETGAYKSFDAMVLVTAPESTKIARVMQRDKCTEASVRERMATQWPDETKIPLADFQLINDDRTPLLKQIEELAEQLL
jgi:dephospho-CoA kinase